MPVGRRHYLMVSKNLMRRIGREEEEHVTVRFGVADQDRVDVPPALQEALRDHPDLQDIWDSWTPGKRRSLAYRVESAKTPPTIAKRVAEVLDLLAEG